MIIAKQRGKRGFTMVELLVVLAIMAILISISAPAIVGIMRSSRLTVGSTQFVNQLALARQYAMANNCQVEVRIYQLPDTATPSSTTPSVYRAFQSYALSSSGGTATPVTKLLYLPDQIYIVNNTTVSSLLNYSASSSPYYSTGTTAGASLGTWPASSYNYVYFHFKPDGSTDLIPSASPGWYVSMANQHDPVQSSTGLPNNFVTLLIDALTGHVRYFRP
jgi:uncharacterized protein (TIGR02596 family)